MEPDYKNPEKTQILARPSWGEYFMMVSKLAGVMATCPKRRVGTVIVKNKRIIATGFNGSPPGLPHCTEEGCLIFEDEGTSCRRVLHSEHNAVLQNSGNLEGATLYTSFLPCIDCMKVIISAKIKEVVYEEEYSKKKGRYEYATKFAQEAGVVLRQIPNVDIVAKLSQFFPV